MKTSNQLKALICNLAKEKSVQAEVILRNYMLERLLERIALSEYRNTFILKGGMLVAAMVGIDARSTMDMDATMKGVAFSEESLEKAFSDILAVPVDDSVNMSIKGFEPIRDEAEYPGIRVSIEAVLDKTKQTIKIDVTSGDIITPKEVEYPFKLLLEDRTISIMAYNLETVLAEKLETILSRGTANSRMRDYYDVFVLTTLRDPDINWSLFASAFKGTATKRDTYNPLLKSGHENLNAIESSELLPALWARYQGKYAYAFDLSWKQVLAGVRALFYKAF